MVAERLKPIKLSPEMEEGLKDMGPDLATLDFEITKAERAGLDVKDMKAKFADLKRMRLGLLKEYT